MATVRKFEELDLWKLTRKLCIEIGLLIDNGNFKQHHRLISQMEGAQVQLWITLLKVLKEMEEENL